jgi:RHS repeat-associated protein
LCPSSRLHVRGPSFLLPHLHERGCCRKAVPLFCLVVPWNKGSRKTSLLGELSCVLVRAFLLPRPPPPCYKSRSNTGRTITYSLTAALGPQAISTHTRPCSRKHVARRSRMQQRGFRYYNPELGRWISRDAIEELGGGGLYRFVENNALSRIDIGGLWGSDVHKLRTALWAWMWVGYRQSPGADSIGDDTDAVDSGATSPFPAPFGDQSYHFNRTPMGATPDTRWVHHAWKLSVSKLYCDWGIGRDDPVSASGRLGQAIHPEQDWVAHGNFSIRVVGSILTWHNWFSPQPMGPTFTGTMHGLPDDIDYDSTGPDGRATVMHYVGGDVSKDWAYFFPGGGGGSTRPEK